MAATARSPWSNKRQLEDDCEGSGPNSPACGRQEAWGAGTPSAVKRARHYLRTANDDGGAEAPSGGAATPPAAAAGAGGASTSSGAAAAAATGDEWVALLVGHMAGAGSMDEARASAAHVLSLFEAAVVQRTIQTQAQEASSAGDVDAKLAESRREGGILKRAVQIQNVKLERAAGELAGAAQQVQSLTQQLAQAQASNYVLTIELQQAAHSAAYAGMCGRRPPDVF